MTETVSQALHDRALIEEATKKSGLIWVRGTAGPSRALWHLWLDGAACLIGDGAGEQPLADLGLADGGTATVTVRSKDKGGRLVAWQARVVELSPESEAWQAAVDELKGKRLNAPDADTLTERWARECRVLRLEPTGETTQRPGQMPDESHAAPAPASPAITRRPVPAALPKLLRRGRKG
ncbi:hypothetical protein CP981_25595 [Streptomyces platensis]|uniref:Uncharacterized protein n=1 Tax=Streptomyces platensis TaxID=58346 RepID=A0AAE6NMH6_STRPT|nr:hypothetical protein [Streptomyces platensis]OSY45316.1 hypothetical protein BG653_03287 [Streptomyces platensis]QEV54550.1 hypothetical protein CP981_25595 [Streptomyces platensis]BCK68767.1 hypothetical protein Srufu_027200 [Streptomyces libani subsp. rufus]